MVQVGRAKRWEVEKEKLAPLGLLMLCKTTRES